MEKYIDRNITGCNSQCESVLVSLYRCHSVLWTTFGSEQKFNNQFCNLYALPFIGVTKSGILKCEGHVACIEEVKKMHIEVDWGLPEGKVPLRRR